MKIRTIMIATGMFAAAVATASAESVYEPTGSAVQGQTAQQEDTIRYISSGRDGHAMAGQNRSPYDAYQGSGAQHGPNVLRDGRG